MKTTIIFTKALSGLRRCDNCKRRQIKCICDREVLDLDRVFLDEAHKTSSVNRRNTCIDKVECEFTMKRCSAYESDAETVSSMDSMCGSDMDIRELYTPKITERKTPRMRSGAIYFERKNSSVPSSLDILHEWNRSRALRSKKRGVSPYFIFVE